MGQPEPGDTHVHYQAAEGVGWITLARPRVLNALDARLAAELAGAVATAAADPAAWIVVVRGEGRAFSSGMDRRALSAGAVDERFFRQWIQALNGLEDMGKLVVAAIRGYCIGGGLQLALACDFRLCADDAVLGLGATRHGLVPDGAVLRLARVVGLGRAKELALLNDHITPAAALAAGLVNLGDRGRRLRRRAPPGDRALPRRGADRHPPHQASAPGVLPRRPPELVEDRRRGPDGVHARRGSWPRPTGRGTSGARRASSPPRPDALPAGPPARPAPTLCAPRQGAIGGVCAVSPSRRLPQTLPAARPATMASRPGRSTTSR